MKSALEAEKTLGEAAYRTPMDSDSLAIQARHEVEAKWQEWSGI